MRRARRSRSGPSDVSHGTRNSRRPPAMLPSPGHTTAPSTAEVIAMAHDRRFRFGTQAGRAVDGPAWREQARRIEAMGYDMLAIPDHFGEQCFSPVVALMAAADATTRLIVGTTVY